MQAIVTKYLGPTNFRGGRIKASCERGSITVSYPDHLRMGDEAHAYAADCLVAKFVKEDAERYGTHVNPWTRKRVVGCIPSGEYVHVFVDGEAIDVLRGVMRLRQAHRWNANKDEHDAFADAERFLKEHGF